MNECEKIQEYFVDVLYGELNPADRDSLNAHLGGCEACTAELAAMRDTLAVMDRRERKEPEPEFWQNFDQKLQNRIDTQNAPQKVIAFRRIPSWAWQMAAALILVGLGVVIGRVFVAKNPDNPPIARETPAKVPVVNAALDAETQRFLDRSEVLLLGVVNTDSASEEGPSMELAQQRKVSRDLIQEASLIRGKLKDPKQRQLKELVSDLELILLQIANLEAQQDQPEIEIVKSGVDRKGLLLKIDLEQMRLRNPKTVKRAPAKQPSPAI